MKIPGGFAPRPPNISFLLTFNFSQLLQHSPDPKISPHYSANVKNFPGGFAHQTPTYFLPVYIQYANLILSPSYILPVNIQLLPLLYPTYQHSPDFYSLQRKFQKFSWGLCPQTPHISFLFIFNFFPLYILSINIHQTPRFLLITAQISKIFLGASPPESRPPQISFLLTFNYAPRPPHKSFL